MQTAKIVQAVILIILIALAASCSVAKEYTSKIFPGQKTISADSTSITKSPRFLDMETSSIDSADWVNMENTFKNDTPQAIKNNEEEKQAITIVPPPVTNENSSKKETSTSSSKTNKPEIERETAPVAKTAKPGTVRTKRSRE